MKKLLLIVPMLVMGCSCSTATTWHVAGHVPVVCYVGKYPVQISGQTMVHVNSHLANGKSLVMINRGNHAGETMVCPTDKILPK